MCICEHTPWFSGERCLFRGCMWTLPGPLTSGVLSPCFFWVKMSISSNILTWLKGMGEDPIGSVKWRIVTMLWNEMACASAFACSLRLARESRFLSAYLLRQKQCWCLLLPLRSLWRSGEMPHSTTERLCRLLFSLRPLTTVGFGF